MKYRLLLLLAAFSLSAYPQAWSTFLNPSRAIDWTSAGFTIPAYTTNCAIQPTLTANSSSAAAANTTAIQNALASCDATHNVVNIPAGTYYMAGWSYAGQGKQVVRGAGPMSTRIYLTARVPCSGLWHAICMGDPMGLGSDNPNVLPPSGPLQCAWTAGYSKGTTTITLSSCGGAPPVNKMIILDQANEDADTNGIWNCDTSNTAICSINSGFMTTTVGTTAPGTSVVTASTAGLGAGLPIMIAGAGPGGINYIGNIVSMGDGTHWTIDPATSTSVPSGTVIHDSENHAGRLVYNVSHSQSQGVYVTGITCPSGGTYPSCTGGVYSVTITPEVVFNNIRSGQLPGAYWPGFVRNLGLENLTLDGSTLDAGPGSVAMWDCYQCWVRNIRSLYAGRDHIGIGISPQAVVRDSYFFQALSHASQSYAIEAGSSGVLVENNIFQQVTNPVMQSGVGSVIAYNFSIDNVYGDGVWMQAAYYSHNAGNALSLWEGNNFNGIWADDIWGSSSLGTYFRNMLTGWQSGKTSPNYPITMRSYARAFNVVGNVLGQPGIQTVYEAYPPSTNVADAYRSIFELGWPDNNGNFGGCTGNATPPACDTLVRSTLMRWGNWDIVTNGTKWDSTEASPNAVPYVSANFTSGYFGTLAHTLPASLYYTSKPSWWPATKAWPPIGPDVTTGNLGTCSGTYSGAQATANGQCTGGALSSAWASHGTSIPAQDCYLNVMQGPPDGTGNVLNFDGSLCYTSSGTAPPSGPAPPTGLVIVVH